jgi:predicted naringenin-chalcone synthase
MRDNDVFIARIATLLPPRYRTEDIIKRVYGQPAVAADVVALATRASRHTGVAELTSVLDFDAYPSKRLISECHTPKHWCCTLVDIAATSIPKEEIGFLSVSYNISSHVDVLPNLACQVARDRALRLVAPPQEVPHYGCAAGILQIRAAAEFCRASNKAALVIVLEQCTWAVGPVCERESDDFYSSLRAHLLFSDGAAAVLVVPESLIAGFPNAIRIIDVGTGFQLGDAIMMRDGRFLVSEQVRGTMPELVASESIRPLLVKHGLITHDVRDWAIHQGGLPLLRKFGRPDILGLSDAQLADSVDTFEEYGNLSSASCLFTLRRQFERPTPHGTKGMAVAFGAGYYFGSMLYERWSNDVSGYQPCPATMPP